MIERREVEAAVRSAFPGQPILGMRQLPKGFDFEVYRVDLEETGPVVFRGQRDFVSSYQGPLDFGRILLGEVRFYERLSHLPVPRTLHFEPDPSKLGFSDAFFTYLPGRPISDLLVDATRQARDGVSSKKGVCWAKCIRSRWSTWDASGTSPARAGAHTWGRDYAGD